MKLDKTKKILVALLFSSTLVTSNAALADYGDAYIDEGKLIINVSDSYKIIIDEKEIIGDKDIIIKIGDNEVILDKMEVCRLKEEAERETAELNSYMFFICTSFGIITVTVLLSNDKMKRK